MRLFLGDCLEVMPQLAENSIDGIVTDPPYGLQFMGKDWDRGVPGVHFWQEALRVAKPGAHLLAFGGTRTHHRLMCAIEDAGWEIRDTIMWVYGSGFPKSLNVSKAIDKAAGAEREILSSYEREGRNNGILGDKVRITRNITSPATEAARQWDGWGTALKPAIEIITLARKPLEGIVAANVLKWGTGALNIDKCRIDVQEINGRNLLAKTKALPSNGIYGQGLNGSKSQGVTHTGRFPANLIHDGSEEVMEVFPNNTGQLVSGGYNPSAAKFNGKYNNGKIYEGDKRVSRAPIDNPGSAARFFKSCPPDELCPLCTLPWRENQVTIETWKPLFAHNAGKNGKTTPAITEYSVLPSVVQNLGAKLVPFVKSAGNLCERCTISIAVALAGIKTSAFSQEELQVILGYIGSYKSYILIQNLVGFAELWGNTDIIPTTQSLSILFGSVSHAITNYTPEIKKSEQKRFLYSPKASRAEREAGLSNWPLVANGQQYGTIQQCPNPPQRNHHPTVKPLALMRYLITLIAPPNAIILDPFTGSGSTGIACIELGFDFIGIEIDESYYQIAEARIKDAQKQPMFELGDVG